MLFAIIIVMMAVGYIFKKRSIQGSCGGLSQLGIEKECNCDEVCNASQLYQISEPSPKVK